MNAVVYSLSERQREEEAAKGLTLAKAQKEQRARRVRVLLYLGLAGGALAGFVYGYLTL